MRNRTYGGVRGRKTKVGRKLLRFPPTRLFSIVLRNYHSNNSYNHKDANREEEPKEPLGIATRGSNSHIPCSVHKLSFVHRKTWN